MRLGLDRPHTSSVTLDDEPKIGRSGLLARVDIAGRRYCTIPAALMAAIPAACSYQNGLAQPRHALCYSIANDNAAVPPEHPVPRTYRCTSDGRCLNPSGRCEAGLRVL